jgi:hypothetical protein
VPTAEVANTQSTPSLTATSGESLRSTFTLSTVKLEAIVNHVLLRS